MIKMKSIGKAVKTVKHGRKRAWKNLRRGKDKVKKGIRRRLR